MQRKSAANHTLIYLNDINYKELIKSLLFSNFPYPASHLKLSQLSITPSTTSRIIKIFESLYIILRQFS